MRCKREEVFCKVVKVVEVGRCSGVLGGKKGKEKKF